MRLVNLTPLEVKSYIQRTIHPCIDTTTHQNLMIDWWETLLDSHVTQVMWLGNSLFMVDTQPENEN